MTTPKRHYHPRHTITTNYGQGMLATHEDRLHDALDLLSSEPLGSPCYGLAHGNAALVLHRLNRFREAEQIAEEALAHLDAHGCPHPPSWVQFARTYAESLVGQGRYAESLQPFNRAVHIANLLTKKETAFAEDLELEKAHAFNSWGAALQCLERTDAAIDVFRAALDIYRKGGATNRVGYSEALTNYANALRAGGRPTTAELALEEALPLARDVGHVDQVRRIQLALIQLGSSLIEPAEAAEAMSEAALEAEREQRYSIAYVRRCIHAEFAAGQGDYEMGAEVVAAAKRLEDVLDENDPNPAKLRMTEAKLLQQRGATEDEVQRVLLDGAHLWFERIGRPLVAGDFAAMTEAMHEHFRMLARSLLQLGRPEEAVTAFEAGRALAHAIEVDSHYLDRVVERNPFRSGGVSTALLEAARETLASDDVLVVLTVLPPDLIAFVVGKDDLETMTVSLPEEIGAREHLFDEIRLIPARLQEGVGARAIPAPLRQFALAIREAVGVRSVCGLLPYSSLHDVPWRALLRDAGMLWSQLPCGVEFGLFLRTNSLEDAHGRVAGGGCVALGHGVAGKAPVSIDLCDEARAVVAVFGSEARVVLGCTASDVEAALRSDGIVLISCHGAVRDPMNGGRRTLALELADGVVLAEDVFPDRVAAELVILSACESGVYGMTWADFPVGAAPVLLRAGARFCIGARFRLGARFAASFFLEFSRRLAIGTPIGRACAEASEELEATGASLWRDLACIELLGGP